MSGSTAAVAFDAKEIIKDMLASFVGSAACVYTGQPFDTVKVRLQCANPGQYTGAIDCGKQVIVNEGFIKLFSGSLPALTGALLENAHINVFGRLLLIEGAFS